MTWEFKIVYGLEKFTFLFINFLPYRSHRKTWLSLKTYIVFLLWTLWPLLIPSSKEEDYKTRADHWAVWYSFVQQGAGRLINFILKYIDHYKHIYFFSGNL